MPRPKPSAPLKARFVRLSDVEWLQFKELGGAEWLRNYVKRKAKYPTRYYEADVERQSAKSGGATGVVAVHTARPQAIPQTRETTTN